MRVVDRRHGRRRSWSPLAVLALAVVLLVLGIGAAMSSNSKAVAELEEGLGYRAAEQTQRLADHFSRTRAIDLITAQNPAFQRFYERPGELEANIERGGRDLDETNAALGYLESLFPASIGEACVIDAGGEEVARVVRGERAAGGDLSNETEAPFFAPAFRVQHGQVYQAKPYVSPDTDEWVIASATPLPAADGSKRAIVHYEITMESFRRTAAEGSRNPILIVDRETGSVLLDSTAPQQVGTALGRPEDRRFAWLADRSEVAGRAEVDGRIAAYRVMQDTPTNANRWYVVAVADQPTGWSYGIGWWPLVMVAVALLLLGHAAVALRTGHEELLSAAQTDPLTRLGNRRRLLPDLEAAAAQVDDVRSVLILCDLNGFKAYNDAFGHPAGDALLQRLGAALADAVRGRGSAYRLGGDEFCVLAPLTAGGVAATVAATTAALSERGGGFSIAAAHGTVVLPDETRDAKEALRLADQRMYAHKAQGRRSAGRQSKDVLLTALRERNPELVERFAAVAALADAIATEMLLPAEDRHAIQQAAELHDIGKVAIPDAMLHKAGPLADDELAFVRRHPIVGERIVSAAPALAPAAELIRASHERYDGHGYPDGLAGRDIPLGARIIAVADAYVAMTADRPWAAAMPRADAVQELRRCAGPQFDPRVVAVCAAVVGGQGLLGASDQAAGAAS